MHQEIISEIKQGACDRIYLSRIKGILEKNSHNRCHFQALILYIHCTGNMEEGEDGVGAGVPLPHIKHRFVLVTRTCSLPAILRSHCSAYWIWIKGNLPCLHVWRKMCNRVFREQPVCMYNTFCLFIISVKGFFVYPS